jgi:hypothetical protein
MNMVIRKRLIGVMILLVALSIGCGGEEPAASREGLDVEGEYSGTMTFTKVEVVYDTDDEERYYKPEEPSDWLGENIEVSYSISLDGNKMTLTTTGAGEGGASFSGDFKTETNEFVYRIPGEEGFDDTVLSLTFSKEGDVVKGRGTIVQTHTETGWVNERTLELIKAGS